MANSKTESFTKARSFLSKVRKQGQLDIFQDGKQVAESLSCAIALLQNFHGSFEYNEVGQLEPSSPDWKVIKALLELVVRLGINPYLSPGVGISRDKQTGSSTSLFAAASAISDHLSSLSISGSLFRLSGSDPDSGRGILFVCAEVLSSHIWITSNTTTLVADTSEDVQLEPSSQPIADIIIKYFIWDLLAAYFQLAFCPNQDKDATYVNMAMCRLSQMCDKLPVDKMIESSFVLLNQNSPVPPPWLKLQVGKQLSKLTMRKGGLTVVLQQLVGHVNKGNAESYDKIATHLAKVPKLVATLEQYFKAMSDQLLPLLLLEVRGFEGGETSRTVITNIYNTAKSLACRLFVVEPTLANVYIIQPIIEPLLTWNTTQTNLRPVNRLSHLRVTEDALVDSLVQVQVLLTAGYRGASSAKELILRETKEILPSLLKLHFQLEASSIAKDIESKKNMKNTKKKVSSNGIAKGFLNQGLGIGGDSEEPRTALSIVTSSLEDLIMEHVRQPVEITLPLVLPLLTERKHVPPIIKWPVEYGEIWEAICYNPAHDTSSAMYISRFLSAVENWSLLVALMGELLHKILYLRKLLAHSSPAATSVAEELLRYMKEFEVLNNKAGSTALEHDTKRASDLVKALLEDENVLSDEDMLELVLHMVNRVLKGFRSLTSSGTEMTKDNQSSITDLRTSLERIQRNACLGEKLRHMSFTLAEEVNYLYDTL